MVRCGVLLCIATTLAGVPIATAGRRDVGVETTATDGPAPLEVTFTSAASAHWDFGDGTSGDGTTVKHTYAAGRWTATWSSLGATGTVQVVAHGILLTDPGVVRYRRRATFRGQLIPADAGVPVQITNGSTTVQATSRADGSFVARGPKLTRGGTWTAATSVTSSEGLRVNVVPELRTGLVGSSARGGRLFVAASVLPVDAGRLAVTVVRGANMLVDTTFGPRIRIKLDTRRLTTYRIRVRVEPNDGFVSVTHTLHALVVLPRLGFGMRSAAVVQLAQELRALHYTAPFTDTFDSRLLDAVFAFEKVQGLPRTGVVDPAFWRRLGDPLIPIPRYAQPADHLEIDKPHQVLYVVRGSRVALILPVSTAGLPGRFTPTGRFAIYRKVTGFDPSPLGTLYDPMYFTGGYAIHGNPSVPPYPASHGCVRIPMWLAGAMYATNPYDETVYVY